METTIRIHTDDLTTDLIEGIKNMFPHKTVDITIQPADETEFILQNSEFARELQERIETYELKKKVVSIKAEELV